MDDLRYALLVSVLAIVVILLAVYFSRDAYF